MGDDLGDVYLSEAAAAAVAPWLDPSVDDATCLDGLRAGAAHYGVAVPAELDVAAMARTRARLVEVAARWRALGDRGALAFRHPGGEDA